MPVNQLHPEAAKVAPSIKRTCDAYEGDVQHYVPKLSGQSNTEYEAYTARSSYYNVVERTLAALLGSLTRKQSTIDGVVGDDAIFDDDIGINEFLVQCYRAVFKTGRVGLLIDFDDTNQHPYIIDYSGDNIINWGANFYVLQECYYAPNPEDRFEQLMLMRYRELYLDEAGLYAVNIWEQTNAGMTGMKPIYEIVDTIEPTIRGMRLSYIPFTVISSVGVGPEYVQKPPLSVLADINIDHFKISVDIGHAAHFIAIPTPYIAGDLQGDTQVVKLGTDQFLHLTAGSSTGFLEYSGAGMDTLFSIQKVKEEQMYSLGSRMLQYKKGVESSDSLQIRLGAEGASLVNMAISLEDGLQTALYQYNLWMGQDVEPVVELNKDVSPTVIDPQQITALLLLFQKGVISLDTLLQRLYEGEIVDDVEEEKEAIAGSEEDPAGEEDPEVDPEEEVAAE